jgi:CDP-diacylglycerol--serine O-phosphatidyltransferase
MTLANGVCGLWSIRLATSRPADDLATEPLFFAGILIFLGMVFDLLDGQLARLTKQVSKFGAELDSLCDMITFGVAPVFIMLAYYGTESSHQRLVWGIGAWFTACAALRLARYNVADADQKATGVFQGLPSPAAAGTVASLAIAIPALEEFTDSSMSLATQQIGSELLKFTKIGMPVLVLALAFLMVSRLPYPHFFNQFLPGRRSFYQIVEIVFALVAIITIGELALPLILCAYIFTPFANFAIINDLARRTTMSRFT